MKISLVPPSYGRLQEKMLSETEKRFNNWHSFHYSQVVRTHYDQNNKRIKILSLEPYSYVSVTSSPFNIQLSQ